jgi:hypothetical protein
VFRVQFADSKVLGFRARAPATCKLYSSMQADGEHCAGDLLLIRKERRCKNNRASAQQSRQRKKQHIETLEQRADELERERARLLTDIEDLISENRRLMGINVAEMKKLDTIMPCDDNSPFKQCEDVLWFEQHAQNSTASDEETLIDLLGHVISTHTAEEQHSQEPTPLRQAESEDSYFLASLNAFCFLAQPDNINL